MNRSAAIVLRRLALIGAAFALLCLVVSGALPGLPDAAAYLLPPALLLLAPAELGYVELEDPDGTLARRAWLTAEGCDLVNLTEDALLAAVPDESAPGTPGRPERRRGAL
jgi:hypothetical protein